jgi:hypothetical protein
LLNRQCGIDAFALVLKLTPDPHPYSFGESFPRALLSVIPKVLWPSKPRYLPSREFERDYMGMPEAYDGHSSPHLAPDLYSNFSYAGVVGGMVLLGALYKCFYLLCTPGPNNPSGVFFYAIFLPATIHYLENNVGYSIRALPEVAAFIGGAALFIGVRYSGNKQEKRCLPNVTITDYSPADSRA